jgi:hypothetical protein
MAWDKTLSRLQHPIVVSDFTQGQLKHRKGKQRAKEIERSVCNSAFEHQSEAEYANLFIQTKFLIGTVAILPDGIEQVSLSHVVSS